jgi:hypothetical protein
MIKYVPALKNQLGAFLGKFPFQVQLEEGLFTYLQLGVIYHWLKRDNYVNACTGVFGIKFLNKKIKLTLAFCWCNFEL